LILEGLRVLIIDTGIEKRIEEIHKKMKPYTFFLSPYPYLEPTLLSEKNWGNGHKELVLLLQI